MSKRRYATLGTVTATALLSLYSANVLAKDTSQSNDNNAYINYSAYGEANTLNAQNSTAKSKKNNYNGIDTYLYPVKKVDKFGPSGFYVAAEGGVAFGSINDVNASATPLVKGMNFATNLENNSQSSTGYLVGAAFGYKLSSAPLRFELEYLYNSPLKYSANPTFTHHGSITNAIDSKISTHVLFANMDIDLFTIHNLSFFVGGGVGAAYNSAETSFLNSTSRQSQINLAWNVGAGINYNFTDNWSAGLSYRYMSLGDVDMGEFTYPSIVKLKFSSDRSQSVVLARVAYKF